MSPRRARSLAPAAVVALLTLSACAGLTGNASPSPSSSAPSSDGPASPEEIAAAADRWGSAPQYVLTTSAAGFEAVPLAAGAYGADGFSLVFGAPTGGAFLLTAVGGAMSADDCADGAVTDVSGGGLDGSVTCTPEDGAFRRTAGDAEEYVVVRDDVLVRVSGSAADHDALREAAGNVRVPTHDELAALVEGTPSDPGGTGGTGGVGGTERGDLPPGDGAPDNSVGAGG